MRRFRSETRSGIVHIGTRSILKWLTGSSSRWKGTVSHPRRPQPSVLADNLSVCKTSNYNRGKHGPLPLAPRVPDNFEPWQRDTVGIFSGRTSIVRGVCQIGEKAYWNLRVVRILHPFRFLLSCRASLVPGVVVASPPFPFSSSRSVRQGARVVGKPENKDVITNTTMAKATRYFEISLAVIVICS